MSYITSVAPYILAIVWSAACAAQDSKAVQEVIHSRCLDCHSGDSAESGVDLTSFPLNAGPELAARVEKMVQRRTMPPDGAKPLSKEQRDRVINWFRSEHILRDGQMHIGITPLRRLTRYELENTLEDLLFVQLKQPYVFSSESAGLEPSTIEQIYPADSQGASGFDNDADRMRKVQVPILKLLASIDFALRKFDQHPTARRDVLGIPKDIHLLTAEAARESLIEFLARTWRGHSDPDSQERILREFDTRTADAKSGKPVYNALLHSMRSALLAPGFIYRLEQSQQRKRPYPVSPSELATRLSYFLWSSMPDDELLERAADGSLLNDAVLRSEISRMLNRDRRIALSENFAAQWLGFDVLRRDKAFYNGETWTRSAYDELLFGFDQIIRANRSILEIVDADWAYLRRNATGVAQARRTTFENTYEDIFAFRRSRTGLKVERFYQPPELYSVGNRQFGGLLTSAGIMRVTSAPNRTNPIRRGVWIMENLIGERLHPPENIPPLAEAEKKLLARQALDQSVATAPGDILKLHTSKDSCRACHQHIDPLGLGLENFSPIGDWRNAYSDGKQINGGGTLPNGRSFETPQQLKKELLAYYRDRIIDNTIRRMLAWAIGRQLEPHDRVTIESIRNQLEAADYRIGALIEAIVFSPQFRMRQDSL